MNGVRFYNVCYCDFLEYRNKEFILKVFRVRYKRIIGKELGFRIDLDFLILILEVRR